MMRGANKENSFRRILITGGTGSLGKDITSYILSTLYETEPVTKVIIYSRCEVKQAEMKQYFSVTAISNGIDLRFVIGDVRDYDRLFQVMRDGKITTVIHAAALKRVDSIEENPSEAIDTNITGARNVIRACKECNVEQVVALSTDKACNPINLYGATKLCSDKLFVAANRDSSHTRFMVVRYGNVFTSRGSVVPFFVERAKLGLSIPVTDDRMTRFSLSLKHAVGIIFRAFEKGTGGEIFVAKTPSYKLIDLAKAVQDAVITKSVIEFTGIRPGEKLHEIMVPTDEAHLTHSFEDYFCIYPAHFACSGKQACNIPADFSYCSNTNEHFLTRQELADMIKLYLSLG